MARGHPWKKPRPILNISGLRNQPRQSSSFTDWPWVPFLAKISLQAESHWNGEQKKLFINYYSNKIISQYWGWCKYHYREHPKNKFSEAKAHAKKVLEVCLTEIIQKFINQSWRFIDAYRKGLTGEAAAWAVRRQKSHRAVSESVMKVLEAHSMDNSAVLSPYRV